MSTDQRRSFLRAATAALATSPWLSSAGQGQAEQAPLPHDMGNMLASWTGKEQIGMLLYPGMTALDFVGPQHMFTSLVGATVHHVAKTMAPVVSHSQLAILPTVTLGRCPRDLDILFVPGGGAGTVAAMRDTQTVQLLAEYVPLPPYNAGTPDTAPPDVTAMVAGMFKDFDPQVRAALKVAQGDKSPAGRRVNR
jgi:cyclohexyl-isocyanide hydratase